MPKRKSPPPVDITRRQAVLDSPINPEGIGEDPAVKALLSEDFVKATDVQALDVALALNRLLDGQASILENQKTLVDDLTRLRARMDQYDQAAQAWEQDQGKFFSKVMSRSAKVRKVGEAHNREVAKGVKLAEQAAQEVRARAASDRIHFEQVLKTQKQVAITDPGLTETVTVNGSASVRLVPRVIRIKHRTWVLPPGKSVKVPKLVADAYQQILRSEQETAERESVLQQNLNSDVMLARQAAIDARYGTQTHWR